MTIDPKAIEAAKEIVSQTDVENSGGVFFNTPHDRDYIVARALLEGEADLKRVFAMWELAANNANAAGIELLGLRQSITDMVVEKDAEGWKFNWQVEVENHGETKRDLELLRQAVRDAETTLLNFIHAEACGNCGCETYAIANRVLRENTAPHMGAKP